jgi:hypothetical protein
VGYDLEHQRISKDSSLLVFLLATAFVGDSRGDVPRAAANLDGLAMSTKKGHTLCDL